MQSGISIEDIFHLNRGIFLPIIIENDLHERERILWSNTLKRWGAVPANGRRIPSQRQIVLHVVESATQHLDVDAIFQRARAKDHNISMATVYRTLTILKEMGLVDRNYVARSHNRELYERAPTHDHFTCLKCYRVMDHVQEDLGVEVSHACVCLERTCQSCMSNHEVSRS